MTVQPAAARWTVSSRLGFIPNTHWHLGRTIDVPLGGTISRYGSTGFYSGILHVLASALVTYFISINCDFKQHFRTASCYWYRPLHEKLHLQRSCYVLGSCVRSRAVSPFAMLFVGWPGCNSGTGSPVVAGRRPGARRLGVGLCSAVAQLRPSSVVGARWTVGARR